MGADSICIKDMAGLLNSVCRQQELVSALKECYQASDRPAYPLYLRCSFHDLLKGCRGWLQISSTTAMSPFALGTSQPATEVMVETFKGTPYDTGFDPGSFWLRSLITSVRCVRRH